MTWFNDCKTLEDLKKEYRRLAVLHHPDKGGDLETMKLINAAHDKKFEELKRDYNAKAPDGRKTTETPEEFRDLVNNIINVPDIVVEICGSWVWVSGNTKPVKTELRQAGFRWSQNKKMWYWHHVEDGAKWSRGKSTTAEIRAKYGSEIITDDGKRHTYSNRLAQT